MKRDAWALLATSVSLMFLGWMIVGAPQKSALRTDSVRSLAREPGLLQVTQDSAYMRSER
jgi:hypothetical protein